MTAAALDTGQYRLSVAGGFWRPRLNPVLWGFSLFVVLACHALAAWWLTASHEAEVNVPQPLPAIIMDLAPAAAPPVSRPVSPPPPAVPDFQPAPHPPAPQVTLPVPPLPQIASEAVLAQPVKKPVKQEQKRVVPKPKPQPQPRPVTIPATLTPAKPQPAAPSATPPQNDAAQQQREAAAAAAMAAAKSNWLGDVVQHIAKFKRVPRGRLRAPLRVLVSFDIDRSGKLLSHHLLQSSGRDDIDEEALAWIDRAAPLPQPPAEIGDAELAHGFTIPFDFMPR